MAHDFKQVMFTMFEQLQRNAVYLAYQPTWPRRLNSTKRICCQKQVC